MTAFLASLAFVVLAEMGDKTQLLAMAFAARFRWQTVMWAVLVATMANHLMAAAAGSWLATVVPIATIKIVAAASFILFGLWTIRGDRLEGEDERYRFSPFWTVAVAFFIAEMGDKTQLATISLAVQYNAIWSVWMGTTAGMMIADAIGIVVGIVMGKRIPERAVKWGAALIFIAFGLFGLWENLPREAWTAPVVAGGLAALGAAIWVMARWDTGRAVAAETDCGPLLTSTSYSPTLAPTTFVRFSPAAARCLPGEQARNPRSSGGMVLVNPADASTPFPGALDETLRERRFGMVFQPIVDLKRRRVVAYEALVRPQLYSTPPALIADAVLHGKLGILGRTLREASIADCPDHPLFINIHPDELLEHFLVQPDDPIFKHGQDVYLELIEAVPLQRLALCAHMLQEIHARGVHVVVDDLGSGYSNLRYLADLEPGVVKIDRELITGLRVGTRRFTLVQGLVNLCNNLGARVVAECIETPEELAAAIEAGCHLGQGYVLARPAMPPPPMVWPLP